jgi:hypothetical protein
MSTLLLVTTIVLLAFETSGLPEESKSVLLWTTQEPCYTSLSQSLIAFTCPDHLAVRNLHELAESGADADMLEMNKEVTALWKSSDNGFAFSVAY